MTTTRSTSRNTKARSTTRRIESFRQRFGDGHFYLACHAALPVALTPDLLYSLWANFQQDTQGEAIEIPWIAVADLMLSNLCKEVGHELYEMDGTVRDELLHQLQQDDRFGLERVRELADFVMAYVERDLEHPDLDTRAIAETQRWRAVAYLQPTETAREIATYLSQLNFKDKSEWIRMASLLKTLSQPLAEFQSLLLYSQAMANFARGNLEEAIAQVKQIADVNNQINIAGVSLPIPQAIQSTLPENSARPEAQTNQPTYLLRWLAAAGLGTVVTALLFVGLQQERQNPTQQSSPEVASSPSSTPRSSPPPSTPQPSSSTPSPSPTNPQPSTPRPSSSAPNPSPSPSPSVQQTLSPSVNQNSTRQPSPEITVSPRPTAQVNSPNPSPTPQSSSSTSSSSPSSTLQSQPPQSTLQSPPIPTAQPSIAQSPKVASNEASNPLPPEVQLNVPFYSQLDNQNNPSGSSSTTAVAMALAYYGLKPQKPQERLPDELYRWMVNNGLSRHDPLDVVKMINTYGYGASFTTNKSFEQVKRELASGYPVIVDGYFTDFGHRVCLVGYNQQGFIVHDSYGEWTPNGYDTSKQGKFITYSYDLIRKVAIPDGLFWTTVVLPKGST